MRRAASAYPSVPAIATDPFPWFLFWPPCFVFYRFGFTPSGTAMSVPSNPDMRQAQSKTGAPRLSLTGVRLRKHAEYQRAYAAGRKRRSTCMSWFLAPQIPSTGGPRVGLTVGKVLGKAHERNRIKRRLREALRRHVNLLPPDCDLILHPSRSVLTVEFTKLEAEIVRILGQANAEAAQGTSSRAKAEPAS